MADKNAPENNNDEIDLIDLIGALWEGKWIIVGVTALVTILGAAYVFVMPQTTTASLILQLTDEGVDTIAEFNRNQRELGLPEVSAAQFAEHSGRFASVVEWPKGLSLSNAVVHDSRSEIMFTFGVSESFVSEPNQVHSIIAQIEGYAINALDKDIKDAANAITSQRATDIKQRVAYLEKQLEIAKAIGQTHSILQEDDGRVAAFVSIEGLPYYHYGSIVIETEIKQLQRELQTERPVTSVDRLQNANILEVSRPEFALSTAPKSNRALLLSFLAGGFLSLIVLVVWRSLKAYWQRQSEI